MALAKALGAAPHHRPLALAKALGAAPHPLVTTPLLDAPPLLLGKGVRLTRLTLGKAALGACGWIGGRNRRGVLIAAHHPAHAHPLIRHLGAKAPTQRYHKRQAAKHHADQTKPIALTFHLFLRDRAASPSFAKVRSYGTGSAHAERSAALGLKPEP